MGFAHSYFSTRVAAAALPLMCRSHVIMLVGFRIASRCAASCRAALLCCCCFLLRPAVDMLRCCGMLCQRCATTRWRPLLALGSSALCYLSLFYPSSLSDRKFDVTDCVVVHPHVAVVLKTSAVGREYAPDIANRLKLRWIATDC